MQEGLLFHSNNSHGVNDVYAMQLDITVSGLLDAHRLCDAVQAMVNRHPNLAARFSREFEQPIQIIPADPVAPWRYIDLTGNDVYPDEQLQQLWTAEHTGGCDLVHEPGQVISADPVAPRGLST